MQSISLYAKLFKWFSLLFGPMTQFSRNQASVAWACTIFNCNQCACVHFSKKSFHCIRWMYSLGAFSFCFHCFLLWTHANLIYFSFTFHIALVFVQTSTTNESMRKRGYMSVPHGTSYHANESYLPLNSFVNTSTIIIK